MPTVVTGTLVDSLGQKWANAPVQFIFFPTPGSPGPFTVGGVDFVKMPSMLMTDANGFFTITLPSNSEITPANSQWQMIVGPNSTYPAIVLNIYMPSGAFDVSSFFTNSGAIKQVQSLFVPRAYTDSEVIVPPNVGQLYYNTTEKQLKYYESGNWVPIGGGFQGMVYPPAGIAVSTGNSWAASIDPAIVAYVDRVNTFAADQYFNGGIAVAGGITVASHIKIVDRQPPLVTGLPNINSEGSNLVFNAAVGGNIYLDWDQGGGSIIFGNGAGIAVGSINVGGDLVLNGTGLFGGNLQAFSGGVQHNWNVGSFQINGGAPNGYVLTGNGSTYVPMPIPGVTTPQLSVTTFDVTPSRGFVTIYQNTNSMRVISGAARCNEGGHVGSVQCLIGPSSPNQQAFAMTTGAEVNNGVIGFNFTVPPNWFYQILANTLTNNQGTGVVGISSWLETQISIIA